MTTINRPRPRHRSDILTEACDPVYTALTPRRTQQILLLMVVLSLGMTIGDTHPDRVIVLVLSLILWAGHGAYITRRGGVSNAR